MPSKHTETAPLLPPASVDFNRLHAECRAGRTPETAAKNAIDEKTVATDQARPQTDEGPASASLETIVNDTSGATAADRQRHLRRRRRRSSTTPPPPPPPAADTSGAADTAD